jgi:uncharacterized protein YfaS (alpha-2-macroglobulin family)
MASNRLSLYLTYALMLTLTVSIFSTALTVQPAKASHANIILNEANISLEYEAGDDVTIEGEIDDVNDDVDEVTLTITGPDSDHDDEVDHDDGDFEFEYSLPNDAEDGIYIIEVEYDDESVFSYFFIDEGEDVEVDLDAGTYGPDDTVAISGNNLDPDPAEADVVITIEDPEGDDDLSDDVELDGDEYSLDVELDDADHGKYAVTVEYNGDEGYAVFEVEEDGGSSSDDPITVEFSKTSYRQGDEVIISGEIENPDPTVEVFVTVQDSDDNEIFDDSEDPTNDGSYQFEFDLESDAELGTYTVTVEYDGDEIDDTFTVTSSSTSGGGTGGSGSGSGSDSGLTARLSKTSLLAGETLTVSGVVPRIVTDEDGVSITITTPAGNYVAAKFPEPASDKSYTSSFVLPTSLAEDEDYRVVVYYDDKEVELSFDITGKASGSVGALTVKTDKTTYSVGSSVTISGQISDEIFVEGRQLALQVFNPDDAPYRFDPIVPEDDGSYSYPMQIGGPLGVTGEWQVKVTYGTQTSETTFDLTGGVPSTPKYELTVEDDTFTIEYDSDGTINSMYVRPSEKKLVVSIDGEQEGQLTLTLPRVVIDAVESGSDIKYVVSTVDTETGEEKVIEITEGVSDANERTITIDYDAGTDLIEIQGTNIVPEFGPLSAIVLAIAVFSIIAVTARFSNRFSAFRQW